MTEKGKKPEETYTGVEVNDIMTDVGRVYALDDAIANQKSLQRPLSFIKPLEDLRAMIARNLVNMTSKGEKVEPEKTDLPPQ